MLTDIGIGLGMLIDMTRGLEANDNAEDIRARLRLHGETVAAFMFGGLCGVVLYRAIGSGSLLVAAALLLLIASTATIRTRPGKRPRAG
jgi:uncharacterized membrane protein YoaK (UPF0700 family)